LGIARCLKFSVVNQTIALSRTQFLLMKRFLITALSLAIGSSLFATSETEVEARLQAMSCIVPVKIQESVTKRIKTMLHARKDTEKLIGRSASFFPIFDQYLKDLGLPADLKYITCLETELNNKTVSSANARGIWQLMGDVHEEFGLRVDATVDERLDLYRGTEAALKDLKRMQKAYEDWELTLAGYNCGVGRLGQAMKRAKSKDFDRVKKFLPQQTQDYIPKFIAFTYVMKNYQSHGLKASLPTLDLQCIASVKTYSYISLTTVANITGLPYEFIQELNAQYGEGYVPENPNGHNIIVPRRVMGALQDYVSNPDAQQQANLTFAPMVVDANLPEMEGEPSYFTTSYTVGEGETLESMAETFNISAYNIMLWNNLESTTVAKGKELTLYLPRVVPKRV
jgi:membrane-bound lytic murein transglycosylase D